MPNFGSSTVWRSSFVAWFIVASAIAGGQTSRQTPATTSAAPPATTPATSPWGVRPVLVGDPSLPRVLLIGDSILNGYHPQAADLLRGKVNLDVWVTPKHVGSIADDLKGVLAGQGYDLILFNDIGLHAWQPGRIPEGRYEPLLRAHLANLRRLAPKAGLVFATTTPIVTKARPFALDPEKNPVIEQRNQAAVKVMEEAKVPVADFYGTLASRLDLSAGDGFHWTKPAYGLIAQLAATRVAEGLGIPPAVTRADIKVVAYVPNWIDLKAFADTIDYPKLTHLNIAFENPTKDRGDLSSNEQDEVLIAKAREHHVKVLVSIGGGSASEDKVLLKRYAGLLDDDRRAAFVGKLVDYVADHGFDGLDVDLEGPSIDKDYGAFIADLATALGPKGKLLTAALSKGYGGDKVPDAALGHLDFVNVMAYDATGPWGPKAPGQHSSMGFARENVSYWVGRGLPKAKAVLGVPFYGYGFGEAFRKRDYPYAEIVAAHPGAENADQVGRTIWYNGIPTIKAKTQYVLDEGLAGVMIWSLDYDAKGERSLLSAIHDTRIAKSATLPRKEKP